MRSRTERRPLLFLLVLTPVILVPFSRSVHAQDCEALADLRVDDTNLLSAAVVPASGDLPEYCRVLGYVRPAINFEIRLPTASWNRKFYMAGCGGFCGKLESDNPGFINGINYGLKRRYAVSTTDSGHWGERLFDGRWAYHNRQAEIDYGYRAVHETARVTKTVIEAFYDRPPEKSYFQGCSNGGRQGNMEAWRYPDDFDGIISGCPHPDITGTVMMEVWMARANTGPDGKNLITPAEARLVAKAVYDACDSLDGLEDGLISDPGSCQFDVATLACDGHQAAACLTANQIDTLKAFYGGPKDSAQQQLFPGVQYGSEPYWGRWILGDTADVSDDFVRRTGMEFMRYMAFPEDPGEQYSPVDFDFNRDPKRLKPMAQIYHVDNPDLDTFRERGGKLLMWHAWGDAAVPAKRAIWYYEAVEGHVGSRESTQGFFRLFLVPGMDHCGIGEGPGITQHGFDPLTALERWVEHGEAPTSLITTKTDSTGNVIWTRPVCPYPQHAVYDGDGDVNDASNFECVNKD